MPNFAAVVGFFLCLVLRRSGGASRRVLHQPFYAGDAAPMYSPPPPPVPEYPFASSSEPDNSPFFSENPSPPPPIPANFASFPANISSVGAPRASLKSPSSKLIVAAVVAVIAAVVVVSVAIFLQVRRRKGRDESPSVEQAKSQRSAGNAPHRPPNRVQVPKLQRPAQTSSEFLYLGTLVNPHGGGFPFNGVDGAQSDDSRSRTMESPELHPLPPLNGRDTPRRDYRNNADVSTRKDEEDEEFYSPRGSLNGVESSIGVGSSSRRAFSAARVENFDASSSNSSSMYSSTASGSVSGESPEKSGSLSASPERILSPRNSIPKSPELFEIQHVAPPHRQLSRPRASESESPSPSPPSSSSPGGFFRPSNESSPRIRISGPSPPQGSPSVSTSPSPQPSASAFSVLPPPPPPPPIKVSELLPVKTPVVNPIAVAGPVSVSPVEFSSNCPKEIKNNFHKESAVIEMDVSTESPDPDDEFTPKPKLKPLHWDKVRASSDRKMVWDQLNCSSFKLNEEMIETLFVANTAKITPKKPVRWQVIPSPGQDSNSGNSVLDPKKAQNIAILLRAVNVTVEEVCEGLLEGNVDTLGTELLEGLWKMAPTKEEERKLKQYENASPSNLGAAERFFRVVLDIPYAFRRVEAMIYVSSFDSEVEHLRKSCEILETACEELRTSRMFIKILEAVLKTGNRMNVGTNRGDAHAFKLDTLLKLVDVKGADGKTTLLHFVVKEIIRSEGARLSGSTSTDIPAPSDDAKCRRIGLQVVSGLSSELSNVKKAATMDSEVLDSDLSKLSRGLGNVQEVVRLISDANESHKFCDSMNIFAKKAEEDIIRIQAQESVALSLVKEITEYFHGNSAMEEAHPFRIFMVVRDFLTVLDRVCKEVGMANERIMLSSAHKFPVPVNPMLQQASTGFPGLRLQSSSGDEGS